jgi:hypothetical protein
MARMTQPVPQSLRRYARKHELRDHQQHEHDDEGREQGEAAHGQRTLGHRSRYGRCLHEAGVPGQKKRGAPEDASQKDGPFRRRATRR